MLAIAETAETAYAALGPDGKAYLTRPDGRAAAVGRGAAALVAAVGQGRGPRRLRILGAARNAPAIAALAPLHEAGAIRLELATPTLAGRHDRHHDDPEAALDRARAGGRCAPSLGGWHPLGAREGAVYAAAAALDGGGDGGPGPAELLAGHPVLERARFIDPRDDDALARVIAGMRDPRWYVDPAHLEKLDRLKAYFALDTAQVRRRPINRAGAHRRMAALAAWKGGLDLDRGRAGALNAAARRPGGFLLRLYATVDRGRRGAEVAAGRCLLRFVRDVWLDWLYPARYPGGEHFVPGRFFARALGEGRAAADAAAAYRRHVRAVG